MNKNKAISKNNPKLRYALWKTHDFREHYTGEPLDFRSLEVDHIIPESLSKNPQKLKDYLNLMDLDENFELNGILNYVPTNRFVNNRKNDELLPSGVAALALNAARKKADKVLKIMELFDKDIKVNKVITQLKTSINHEDGAEYVYDMLSDDYEEFKEEKYINKDGVNRSYKYSIKRIELQAFLPSYRDFKGSCLFTFRTLSIRGCMISMDSEQIINQLFKGINTNPEHGLRGFISHPNGDKGFYIQLANNRFILNSEETNELCSIVDDFVEEYFNSLVEVEKKLNTINFVKSKNDGFKLIRIDNELWRKIISFTAKNDAFNSSGEWSVFEPNEYMLKIYTNNHEKYGSGHHAIIHLERDYDKLFNNYLEADNKIWLVWKPYFKINKSEDIESLNDKGYWSIKKVFEWLTSEMIPRVIYEDMVQYNIWGKPKVSFEGFVNSFDVSRFVDYNNVFLIQEKEEIDSSRKLLNIIDYLQSFFSTYETIFLRKEEIENIYKGLLLIINNSKKIGISYISGNLGFTNARTMEKLIEEINNYIQKIDDSKIGSYTIDTTLSCLQVCLRDFECKISLEEIHNVYFYLEPLINIYNRDKILKKNI
ncbi:HNH endonuclease [Oceanirhabdus seepicola]|uniref:HNH endonuclease n=1 Tax=Oceanirhabdus seepicola TaxID=2828781 RepID=A0A9J6P338_9CLOT|nr:hypothetical protein [Oceanirhabdus seepicola]MCM1991162.1 hypothetical protein [Oceanirhabdus seepicola]